MCGIAGILNYSQLPPNPVIVLQKMLAGIQYRGPDENGIYCDDRVALGNVRLSIIDLSTGQQPMCTPDRNLWIVYNGEIFNYVELKNDLIKAGHVFHTESDTEVFLHAYQEYGTGCFQRLNGQFAAAIWDIRKKELLLARDRVGIRPLFFTWCKNTFIFGSEIKAMLEFPDFQTEIDNRSMAQIFTFWTTIGSSTSFKNIGQLKPGHYLKINQDGIKNEQWWKLSYPARPEEYFQGSFNEAKEQLSYLLEDAVRLRLRADVPVAAYLSGGLDSSTTTALIKKIAPASLQTFSIGFEDDEFDETIFQQAASDFIHTRHTSFHCTNHDIGALFPTVIWHTEMPVLRTAPVPMYCLSKKVREQQIKVVITGEGADEMLAGYDIFKEAIIRQFWARYPDSKYRPLLLKKLYPYLARFRDISPGKLKFFYGYKLSEVNSPFYSHLLRWHNTGRIMNYFSAEVKNELRDYDPYSGIGTLPDKNFDQWDGLARSQWLESEILLSGYLLSSQGDRMAMANSVEGRYPFLDHRLMNFASSLPPAFKMHGLNEKFILKEMMRGKLPEMIVDRSKQAYRAPVSASFFSGKKHPWIEEMLSPENIQSTGIFDFISIHTLVSKIKENKVATEVDNMALTAILSTQLLHFLFVSGKKYKPALAKLHNCNTILNYSKE